MKLDYSYNDSKTDKVKIKAYAYDIIFTLIQYYLILDNYCLGSINCSVNSKDYNKSYTQLTTCMNFKNYVFIFSTN